MAEKKKKSIYSRKLKDVNKDGKKNFGDTWLGDMLGADGKAGIQKGRPGLKASLKGARREDGKADTTAKKAKKEGNTTLSKLLDKKGETPGGKSKLLDEKGKTPRTTVDTTDDSRSARTKAATKKTTADKGTATKKIPARSKAENNPPENPRVDSGRLFKLKEYQREEKRLESLIKSARDRGTLDRASEARLRTLRKKMKDLRTTFSKGGMAKKKSGYSVGGSVRPRTGHTDLRKGLFK